MVGFILGVIGLALVLVLIFTFFAMPVVATKASVDKSKSRREEPVHAKVITIDKGAMISNVVFELDNGNRISLPVSHEVARMLAVGDTGMLQYYKTSYNNFERDS